MNSLVSIIIPAYNKANLTVKTIESVLAQTYNNREIIVVDDGSTDDTKEKLSRFKEIQYVLKDNGGACSARNLGIRLSKGEYVAFLDCDDLFFNNKIELSIDYFKNHPDVGLVHTAASFIDDKGDVVGEYSHPKSKKVGWITNRLILGNYICNSTIVAKKACFDDVGGFDESIFMPADWDMWLRISEKYKVGYVDTPLTKYRVTDNYILKRIKKCQEEELYVIDKFFERNSGLSGRFKGRVLSSMYVRYAQCFLLEDNKNQMKKNIILSLKSNPFNLKTHLFLASYIFANNWLKTRLNKKILRYSH